MSGKGSDVNRFNTISSGDNPDIAENKSDSSGGEMFAIGQSDSNSNYTETSVKAMSNDGTSSQGSGFSYLKNKSAGGTRSIKSNSTLNSGRRKIKPL